MKKYNHNLRNSLDACGIGKDEEEAFLKLRGEIINIMHLRDSKNNSIAKSVKVEQIEEVLRKSFAGHKGYDLRLVTFAMLECLHCPLTPGIVAGGVMGDVKNMIEKITGYKLGKKNIKVDDDDIIQ